MTEAELLTAVTNLCDGLGLLWHHCSDSRSCHGRKGFPDLIIFGRAGMILVELKSDDGVSTAEQDLWLWTADRAGSRAYLWRPSFLKTGRIRSLLEEIA